VYVSLHPQTRFFSILVPAIVAGGVSVAMMVNVVNGQADQFTWTILLFSLWVVFDHVVALAHPDSIRIDENQIALSSFGRTHTYAWSSGRTLPHQTLSLRQLLRAHQ
jgi:hypothetical protein